MLHRSSIILFLSLILPFCFETASLWASSGIEPAYAALAEYDYFKARSGFRKNLSKRPHPAAAYGLALISMRSDNPFHNLDTAVKYGNLAFHLYLKSPLPFAAAGFTVDSLTIRKLTDTIAYRVSLRCREIKTVASCNEFLLTNYLCRKKYIYDMIYLRDELQFNHVLATYKSDTTRAFIITHPQSIFLKEAYILLDRQMYDEQTKAGTVEAYLAFVRRHPKNMLLNSAYEKLFELYRQQKDLKGLELFVTEFPKAPQHLEAWKLLFSLSVKAYTYADLKKFIDDFPQFPLKNSILKELELNKLVLFPIQKGDYMGFCNEEAEFVIAPTYDEASEFSEGLAVVSRNDSVFYINKENENLFGTYFDWAGPFHNGIAAIKRGNKYLFINRQGQINSPEYDELQELSGGVYVFRKDEKYGSLDQFGQALMAPQFEKLGDFKNGYAYYTEQGKYGFVSRDGVVHKAEYDWISDFNESQLAVIRLNGKYGLVNGMGKQMLECRYDQLLRCPGQFYMLILENQYGFYSFDNCFVTSVQYDFQKERSTDYYCNGSLFRLNKKNESSLVDHNGKVLIASASYTDFGFPSEGLTRVKQKNKWGYLDRKLSLSIPFKYTEASDFIGGIAIVKLKENYSLITAGGDEVYTTTNLIKRLSTHYFSESSEVGDKLLNRYGATIAEGLEKTMELPDGRLVLYLKGGEIKLIND